MTKLRLLMKIKNLIVVRDFGIIQCAFFGRIATNFAVILDTFNIQKKLICKINYNHHCSEDYKRIKV